MKNYEIKLKKEARGLRAYSAIIKAIQNKLDKPWQYNTIKIAPSVDLKTLSFKVTEAFGAEQVETRDGARNGCYGSSTGEVHQGLTCYFHPSSIIERVIEPKSKFNDKACEWVNVHTSIVDNGGKLIEDLDAEAFEEACENLGLSVKSDNSYNWSGNSEVIYVFDFDFAVIQNEPEGGKCFLSIKYHCGGDPRGNYTSKMVYQFDSIDDLYSAILPSPQLLDEES